MTFIGIALLLVAVAALVAGIVQVASAVTRFTDGPPGSYGLDSVRLPGSLSFTGEDGEEYAIVVTSTSPGTINLDDVTVTDPDGRRLALSISSLNFENTEGDSHTQVRALTFFAPVDGIYNASVKGSSAGLSGYLTAVSADELTRVFGGTALGLVSIAGSALCGTLGLGLTIGGGIWWNSRNRAKRRTASWPQAPGAPMTPGPPPKMAPGAAPLYPGAPPGGPGSTPPPAPGTPPPPNAPPSL